MVVENIRDAKEILRGKKVRGEEESRYRKNNLEKYKESSLTGSDTEEVNGYINENNKIRVRGTERIVIVSM